jgi:uncharacterized RDD family membrane protein YckC
VEPTYPGLFRRYLSTLLDGLLLIAAMLVVPQFLQGTSRGLVATRVGLLVFLVLGYEPLLTTYAYTLGQYIMGIRVRRASDPTRRINLLAVYVRYLVKLPLGFISLLTIGFTRQRRALHDFVARSIMIDVRRPEGASAA